MMYGPGDGGWWGTGMVLVALLFLALIVIGVILVVRSPDADRPRRRSERSRAREILDERFARGEIDAQEYEERRRTLEEER